MRTTVGPLPSAVYWRRRAVVLGAALLGIVVLFVSCSGDDKDGTRGKGTTPTSQYPTPAPASSSAEPSFLDDAPGGNNPSLPALGDLQSGAPGDDDSSGQPSAAGVGNGQNTNVTAPVDGSCADQEFSVVASEAAKTLKRGSGLDLVLTVKNVGSRACSRDVGAGPQELYLLQGARKYWSSDDCSVNKSNDVRLFNPGDTRSFRLTWNGRQSSSCAGNEPSGPVPPPGVFELRARLGTLVSDPIPLTMVD